MNKEDKIEVVKEDPKTFLVEHVTGTEDTSKQNEEVNKSVPLAVSVVKKLELKTSQDKPPLKTPPKNTEIEKLSSSQKKDPPAVQMNSFDKHVQTPSKISTRTKRCR